MKTLFKSKDGYAFGKMKIAGHEFSVFKTRDGYYSVGAPMGNTPEEKEMFDKLVYYNKNLYHGKELFVIKRNIKNFIKNNQ